MHRRIGDKKWTLVEDTVEPVAENVAQGLRDELLLDGDWEVLKDLSADALQDMCRARKDQGLKVQGDNKTRNTEEKRHTYYLDKLLQWLKKEKVKTEADGTEAVQLITEQLQSAPREPAQAPASGSPQLDKEARELANRIKNLETGDREMIKNLISTFEQKKKKFEAENALRNEAEAENARLRQEIEDLREAKADEIKANVDKLEALDKMKNIRQNVARGFMSRAKFSKLLDEAGLLTKSPGKPGDGQDVFHIIASSNGGPDHVDNYLYALGASFNRKIGANLDHVICLMAGRENARRAVRIALDVAKDPKKWSYIDRRGKKRPTLFTEGHKGAYDRNPTSPENIGDDLYNQGDAAFSRFMRQDGRDCRKSK